MCVLVLRTGVYLPFHMHQRIDGNMDIDKEGIRATNQKVLRDAPCSIGILVDRTVTGFQQPHCSNSVQHVAILFFGELEALMIERHWHVLNESAAILKLI